LQAIVEASLAQAAEALERLRADQATLRDVARAGELLVECFRRGGRVYSCGNGGSMCDAMHFAEELSGKFRRERAALPAMAISDAAHLTCAGNDFGFDSVFARFVEAHANPGDVLLAISTSGTSKNVLAAAAAARQKGAKVIALIGRPGTALAAASDLTICTSVDTPYSDRIQELHIKVIHTLIELCERQLFPQNYSKS
jgi:D-sedoheptulose 7-phosphate isomerase